MDLDAILAARQQRIDEFHVSKKGQTALIVIDMQRGFLEEGASLEVAAGRDIIPNIARLIKTCRDQQIPVIFTEFVYATSVECLRGDPFGVEHLPAGETTGFGFPSSNCLIGPGQTNGPDSVKTVPELAPLDQELVVQGHTYDKFYGTPLDLALRCQNISHLLLTGVTTDVCVNSTLLAATTRNYRATVITDGVASPWPDLHEACFKIWEKKFARLRTTDEICDELSTL